MSRSDVVVTRDNGRLKYVEPTNISVLEEGSYTDKINFPYEDYNIAVDLIIRQANRYSCGFWLDDGAFKETMFSSSNGTLAFNNGSKYGDDRYLTTNFTDISNVEPEKNTSECLGISSINIAYDSWIHPLVTIKFIDVRGATIMQPAEKNYYKEVDNGCAPSFYKALFSFPPPTFVLRVKGFYGRPVSYNLKLNTADYDFDCNTGNFNITANFIGEIYGIYANLPLTYVACAPFMKRGKKYWQERVAKNEFVFRDKDGNAGAPMITIPELQYRLAKVAESQEAYSAASEGKDVLNSHEEQTGLLKTIQETFPFNSWYNNKDVPYVCKCFSNYNEADDFINILSGYVGTVISYDKSYNTNYQDLMKPIIESLKKNEKKTIEESFIAVEYVTLNDNGKTSYSVNGKTSENYKKYVSGCQSIKEYIENNRNGLTNFKVLLFEKKGSIFDGNTLKKQVNNELASLTNSKRNREKILNDNRNTLIENVLGFRPSIRNMFELMFAHMDTFMHCFYESMSTIKSQLDEEKEKRSKKRFEVFDGMSDIEDESVSDIGKYIPPFAAFYDDEGENGTTLKWPEELTNGSELEEVKFIYELLDAVKMFYETEGEVAKQISALSTSKGAVTTNNSNNNSVSQTTDLSTFLPTTTYDYVNIKNITNPYKNLSLKIQDEVNLEGELITLFVHRLFYFASMQDKDFKKSCSAFGKIEAINLYKVLKDKYSDKFNEVIKKYVSGDSKDKGKKESILDNITGNTENNISKLWSTESVNLNKKLFKIEGNNVVYNYHKGFSFKENEIDVEGYTIGGNPYKVVPNKKYVMFPLYFQSFSELQKYYSEGVDMLANKKMICADYDETVYGGTSKLDTFFIVEDRDYIKKISSSLESEIKKVETEITKTNKEYGKKKNDDYKISDVNILLDAYNKSVASDEWGKTYLLNSFCDENEKSASDITKITKIITTGTKEEGNKFYIKYPSIDNTFNAATSEQIDTIFTNPVYKLQTDLKAKAYLFLQSLPIYSKFFVTGSGSMEESKNGLALKAKLLREGSYYWREDNMDAVKFGEYKAPKKDETLITKEHKINGVKILRKDSTIEKYEKWKKPDLCTASRRRVLKKYFEDWAIDISNLGFAANETLLSKSTLYGRSAKGKVNIKSDPAKLRKELAKGSKKEKDVFEEERKFNNGLDIAYKAHKDIKKDDGARKLQSFLRDLFFTVCTTFEMFDVCNNKKKMKCSKEALECGLTSFMTELNAIYGQTATDKKTEKEGTSKKTTTSKPKAEGNDPLNNKDLKLSTYMTMKSLYDKYLSCPSKGPNKTWLYNGGESASEFNHFYYVDNFYNDIGFKLLTNVSNITSWLNSVMATPENTTSDKLGLNIGKTMLNYICAIAENCGGRVHFLPQRFGLYSLDDAVDMFTPFNTNTSVFEDSSSCIFMYSYKMSEQLGDSKNNEDLNGYNRKGDSFFLTDDDDASKAFKGNGYNVPSFGVTYAKQNQSIFKNIQLTSKGKGETEVSIAAKLNIAAQGSKGPRESKLYGQDLYNVYSNMSFNCGVDMLGNAQIMPLMYFQLNNIPFWRGAYIVHKVTHSITPGNMVTHFDGVRVNRNTIPLSEGVVAFGNNEVPEPATAGGGGGTSNSGPKSPASATDVNGNPNISIPDVIDFDMTKITDRTPLICVTPSHGPRTQKKLEWAWSSKVVDRMVQILKTYKYTNGQPYQVQRCNKDGNHTGDGYSMTETKTLINRFGSTKVVSVVPHWNGGGGNYYRALKGGKEDSIRKDSLQLLSFIKEESALVKTKKDSLKIPNGMMDGTCEVSHFPARKKKNKDTGQEYTSYKSSDGATMLNCACALSENWFADYPKDSAWSNNSLYNQTDANGKFKTGRGWMESAEGIETIAQINAKGIKKYVDYVGKNGPIGGGGVKDTVGNPDAAIPTATLDPNIDYEAKMKEAGLVDIMSLPGSEGIKVQLKYATTDNVAKKNVYGKLKKAYFTKSFAEKIIKAHKAMKGKTVDGKKCGGIMIYDGARPNSVQKYMRSVAGTVFAKPYEKGGSKGSLHSYGTAVDLTIYDSATGKALDMGAGFDTQLTKSRSRAKDEKFDLTLINNFSKTHFGENSSVYKNREFLYKNMKDAGFIVISNEWWHFQEHESNDKCRSKGKLLDF